MNISVLGCGRWGSFIAWYLNKIQNNVTLYGRKSSEKVQSLIKTRKNAILQFNKEINITTDLKDAIDFGEIIIISIGSQHLRQLIEEIKPVISKEKIIVLCMKGIETKSLKRLSQVVFEYLPENPCAIWVGPGHVQEFADGVPNCMVIDSQSKKITKFLADSFSSDLIRFYYGEDLIGSEIGAASKNVIGIAAGMLDGFKLSSLKGALMARGTSEIARLIHKMGGEQMSAYGLCHLGDYEATVFSKHSHNRMFGEAFILKQPYDELAEGAYTVKALIQLGKQYDVDLPICKTVYNILYTDADPKIELNKLFSRSTKTDLY
ncbi:MAG: NAD(P)H-dependent glycerol-3-phosphate dehydrogenase [Clostridia bacterium]